jgi:hypothetical protein
LAIKLNDTNSAARILDIPIKNLKRWIKQGYIRKKGGRKTQDPKMENELKQWIYRFIELNKKQPCPKLIKKMAKRLSNYPDKFKASKGWFEKFLIRFNQQVDSVNRSSEDNMMIAESQPSLISDDKDFGLSFRSKILD